MSSTIETETIQPVERLAVGFAHLLRAAGLTVPVDSVQVFVRALGLVGLSSRDDVYWCARAALVRRPEDVDDFDAVFAAFWDQRATVVEALVEETTLTLATDDAPDGDTDSGTDPSPDPSLTLRFTAVETLRDKDFADYSDEEMQWARHWMDALRATAATRPSLRWERSRRRGARPDMRRTVRASFAAGGEPLRRRWSQRGRAPRRVVFLLDVSGSMEPYARALVRYVHAGVAGRVRVEAFALGTRLTRITRELSARDPDRALSSAGAQVKDWSGGTRLGETLRRFNDEWGVRGTARGSIVVILSDGWDRGDPEILAEQMARLGRVAHRIVWVNPLKVTPGYAPLARGMAAALPYVDDFVEGHSLSALEHLTRVITRA